jgi:Ca2+-binding RTX toxin-like protein
MATINGDDSKNDRLTGTDLDDVINGLGGNDTLIGGAGKDQINGGGGDDYLEAGGFGVPYDDTAFHKAADDILNGGAGNDTAYIDYGDVVLVSTEEPIEAKFKFGSSFQIQIQGFVGATITDVENIYIRLANGNDDVTLGAGNDTISGGYGDDKIIAGTGNDTVIDLGGYSDYDGGDGDDAIRFDRQLYTWDMSFNLQTGAILASGEDAPVDGDYGQAINFESLSMIGSKGKDTIIGGDKADQFTDYAGSASFTGGGGDDSASLQYGSENTLGTLIGGGGNDYLAGKYGTISLDGGTGHDTLVGSYETDDTIHGGEGNDIIHVSDNDVTFRDGKYYGEGGNDTVYAGWDFGFNDGSTIFDGGAGTDKLIIGLGNAKHFDAQTEQGVQIADFATVSGFEQFDITGSDGYSGFDGGENIATLDLADIIRGGGGNDTVNGRGGDDLLEGGEGADSIVGGSGNDTASYENCFAESLIISLVDPSQNTGEAVGDTYSGIENITGGLKSDTITGGDNDNVLAGGRAENSFTDDDGDDVIDGGGGTDTAVFSHSFAKYTIVKQDDGSYLVTDSSSFDGNGEDTLIDIEKAKFLDKTVNLGDGDNTPPKGLKLSNADVDENTKAGALIGKASAKDADGDTLTYMLIDDAAGAFDLKGDKLVSAKKFDFEVRQSYSVKIEVSDGTDSISKLFTITVNDVMETIKGTAKANALKGGIGADEIIGLAGNDKLTGGKGNDIFVFSTGFDKDTVLDFDAKNAGDDRIDLSGLRSVSNFTDLKQHHMQQKGGDVVIDGGAGDVLTLKDVDIGDLAKGDFIF